MSEAIDAAVQESRDAAVADAAASSATVDAQQAEISAAAAAADAQTAETAAAGALAGAALAAASAEASAAERVASFDNRITAVESELASCRTMLQEQVLAIASLTAMGSSPLTQPTVTEVTADDPQIVIAETVENPENPSPHEGGEVASPAHETSRKRVRLI